jgi:hypothetical protein
MDKNDPTAPDGMIIERRELRFDPVALKRVIAWSLGTAAAHRLPKLPPGRIELLPHDDRVDLIYTQNPPEWSFPLELDALGSLLIAYCIHTRIPLPRSAHKELRFGPDYIALVVLLKYSHAGVPRAATMSGARHSATRHRH